MIVIYTSLSDNFAQMVLFDITDVAVCAEVEQLKMTVVKLRQEAEEKKKWATEKDKEAQHWASEVQRLHQAQEQHINEATKGLSSQVTSLKAQLNDSALKVHQLHEENRKLKEKDVNQYVHSLSHTLTFVPCHNHVLSSDSSCGVLCVGLLKRKMITSCS